MDTVTQITLGAAVGEAVLGRKVGRRAMLWGAGCGLFPDLDILIPLGDAVRNFTYHRGPSHSLFVLAALTPVFAAMIIKLHPDTAALRRRWMALVYLAFATHVLLDSFTVYGTQILWPLNMPPVMWSTVFIIDPLYTLPLIAGVLAALLLKRTKRRGYWFNMMGIVLSSLYLAWSVGAKLHVNTAARQALARQAIAYDTLLTVPTPLNTILWRIVARSADGYYEGYYSLLDEDSGRIDFAFYPSRDDLLTSVADHWPVRRLQWFTHGFYGVGEQDGDVVIADLRMGAEPDYVFRFKVAEIANPHPRPTPSERLRTRYRADTLRQVWTRMWGRDAADNRSG